MNKKLFLFLSLLVIVTLACGGTAPTSAEPDQAQLETMVAATLQAVTQEAANNPTATSAPSGTAFTYNNIELIIPDGFATGTQTEIVPRTDATDDMPYWIATPEYLKVTFSQTLSFTSKFEAVLQVLPAEEFMQMSENASEKITTLQSQLASGDPKGVKVLPPFNAGLMLDARNEIFDFQNGNGVRSIQEYHQYSAPITNDYLIYSYQGITSDGKYYVSFVAPIRVPFLIDDSYNPDPNSTTPTPLPPAEGFTYPSASTLGGGPEYDQYIKSIADKFAQTPPEQFSPSLDTLDALVRSILIK